MPTMPLVGDELAGYRLMGVVGRGGMSVVYRAENPRLGSTVALKVLAPEIATDDLFRTRFLQESRIAASLSHPNVIPIYDMGSHADLLYIAMRFVNGHDMRDLLRTKHRLPPSEALYLVGQCGRALDFAHRHSLVHRDVKPANMLVEAGVDDEDPDHVFLADFGITKHALSRTGLTPTGQFMGTLDYVAPEQIQGKVVGKSADIYSLGCVLYEGLTGQVPFIKDIDAAVLWAHVEEFAPPPSSINPALPVRVDEVMARALSKDPADRHQTCKEMVADARSAFADYEQPTAIPRPVVSQRRPAVEAAGATSAAVGAVPDTRPATPSALNGPATDLPPRPRSQTPADERRPAVPAQALPARPRLRSEHHEQPDPSDPPDQLDGRGGSGGAATPPGKGGASGGASRRRAVLVSGVSALLVFAVVGGIGFVVGHRGQTPGTTPAGSTHSAPTAGGSSGMAGSTSPSASANPLVKAIALANVSSGGMLPAAKCAGMGMDAVSCDNPHLGIGQAVFRTYPSLNALYASYEQKVRGLSDGRFRANYGDCTRAKIDGEVSWNHNYVHPRHYSVARVASGMLRDDIQAAGRVFCRLHNDVITIVWTDNHARMLGTVDGAPHPLVFRWWKLVHHDLAVGDMPMDMGK